MGIEAPHDTFFRAIFQHAACMASWLGAILPASVARAIDWRTLTPATDTAFGVHLRRHQADLVFTAALRPNGAPVLILVEHKAQPDAQLASQLQRYAVHLRRAASRHNRGVEPLVVVAVLHHGSTPLPAAPPHPQLSALPDADAADFAAMQPQLSFTIDDLAGRDEHALHLPGLLPTAQLARYCLRFFWQSSGDEVLALLARWADLLRAADRDDGPDVADAVCWYALAVAEVAPEALIDLVSRILLRPEDTIMSTLERTYQKGRAEGLATGKAEGCIDTLLRQLHRRFGELPAEVAMRVRGGSPADLDRWTDRILDARSLTELFAD